MIHAHGAFLPEPDDVRGTTWVSPGHDASGARSVGDYCQAFTSRAFDIATKDLAAHSQSGGQFFGIHASNDGRIMIFAGGIPLKRNGAVVGAIGVSGGSGQQDHAVAEAGAAGF